MYYESLEDITNYCSQTLSRHIFIDHAIHCMNLAVQF